MKNRPGMAGTHTEAKKNWLPIYIVQGESERKVSGANRQKNQRVPLVVTSVVLWTGSVRSVTARNLKLECGMWIWSTSVQTQPDCPPRSRPTFTSLMGLSRLLLFSFLVTFKSKLQVPDAFPHARVPFGAERVRDHHHISASYIMLLTDGRIALLSLTSVPSSLPLFHHTVSCICPSGKFEPTVFSVPDEAWFHREQMALALSSKSPFKRFSRNSWWDDSDECS